MFGLEFTRSQIYGSNLELIGVITGLLSVFLLLFTKQLRLQWVNWPCSVISAAIYFKLFHEWHLYGNMALQVPFLIISVIGLWVWRGQLTGIVTNVKELPTTYCTRVHWNVSLFMALVAEIPAYFLLRHYGDISPLWDGLIFTISIAAIYLQLKKYVQSWYLWILVDLIAVPFHTYNHHGATGLLYLAYMIMCFFGLAAWRREANHNEQDDGLPSGYMTVNDIRKKLGMKNVVGGDVKIFTSPTGVVSAQDIHRS